MTALELEPIVHTVTLAQTQQFTAPLVLAFVNDPTMRWMYPDAHQYRTFFPALVRAFGRKAFALGTAQRIGDFHGASLWLPPGVQPDEEQLVPLAQETVAPALLRDVLALLGAMGVQRPQEPHWYLPLLGVDPLYQGFGLGSALLAQMLGVCDEQSLPAYLESTNERNVPFYRQHGFEVCRVIQAGSSPRLFAMQRAAR